MVLPATEIARRQFLGAAGLSVAASWLTPVAARLAHAAEKSPPHAAAKSIIVLWLQGGPSQLETFDPHANDVTSGVEAIKTAAPGIEIAKFFPQLAEQMESVSLVRSVTSKEGDHERATYNMRTGFRPDPTLIHPATGAILCHQSPDRTDIPRHISLGFSQFPARGGYLGDQYDSFKVQYLDGPLPNVRPSVAEDRFRRRVEDLEKIIEPEFARGRLRLLDEQKTLHRTMTRKATTMMSSEQLKAFDLSEVSAEMLKDFGDTEFGRGCVAALRLIKAGVRCVEVNLGGFDSHINNRQVHERLAGILDPAFAALIRHLKQADLFDHTVVFCGGEFGRTPIQNATDGRDHWPHGFSVALAGGGIVGGRVIGETNPKPDLNNKDRLAGVAEPHGIEDVHATMLHALGLQHDKELVTPIGRPMKLSEGRVIRGLLDS